MKMKPKTLPGSKSSEASPIAKKPPRGKSKNEIDDIFNIKSSSSTKEVLEKPLKADLQKDESKENESSSATLRKENPLVPVVDHTNFRKEIQTSQKRPGESSVSNRKRARIESKAEFLGENRDKSRFTDEGYPVYYLEDLVSEKGGDTELCPFDCECCF